MLLGDCEHELRDRVGKLGGLHLNVFGHVCLLEGYHRGHGQGQERIEHALPQVAEEVGGMEVGIVHLRSGIPRGPQRETFWQRARTQHGRILGWR